VNERREFELLADIAKLLKKYGAEVFEQLARILAAPETTARLASILSGVVKEARGLKNGGAGPRTSGSGIRSLLIKLAEAEPSKSSLLLALYDDLKAKRILPTLRDFRAFAISNSLPLIQAAKRANAVECLMDALILLPQERVESLTKSLRAGAHQDDRSLAGWTRIILGNEHQTKKAAP
jgi:hypothetical protein